MERRLKLNSKSNSDNFSVAVFISVVVMVVAVVAIVIVDVNEVVIAVPFIWRAVVLLFNRFTVGLLEKISKYYILS